MPGPAIESGSSSGNLPPATPTYVFRGHDSALHALHFFSGNRYLASADAEGWIIVWNLATRRAAAVWKAHDGSVLGIKNWGSELLVTHGRDHSLKVWQLKETDIEAYDKTLPAAQRGLHHSGSEPWMLHSLAVNALNFCAFSLLEISQSEDDIVSKSLNLPKVDLPQGAANPVIVACSNALDSGGIDIFHLPSERRISMIKADQFVNTGMVMALKLVTDQQTGQLVLISGYEDGHVVLHRRLSPVAGEEWQWRKVYLYRAHSQPVLSLDAASVVDLQCFVSSSADAMLVKHPFASLSARLASSSPLKSINTKHAGQQNLTMRDDGKIFATAGWDSRIRVYSSKSMDELAVLKWHKEGCYSVAFASTSTDSSTSPVKGDEGQVTISALEKIKQTRATKSQQTHWLAAGGKDGKISLWDIY